VNIVTLIIAVVTPSIEKGDGKQLAETGPEMDIQDDVSEASSSNSAGKLYMNVYPCFCSFSLMLTLTLKFVSNYITFNNC